SDRGIKMHGIPDFDELQEVRVEDLFSRDWSDVARQLREGGPLKVADNERCEAVILDVETYQRLARCAHRSTYLPEAERTLRELRAEFDERLATMRRNGGLAATLAKPPIMGRRIKLGPSS